MDALTHDKHLFMVKILIELSQGRLDFSEYDTDFQIPVICKQHLEEHYGQQKVKQ
jgi:hypothetical protein